MKIYDGGVERGTVALGIDQSYTGFAITAMSVDGDPLHRSYLHKSSGAGAARLSNIRQFLDDVRRDLKATDMYVSTVALEGYAPGAKYGREMAGELGGLVKLWLHDNYISLDIHVVAPTQLKKYITGKGTGISKNQILLQVYKKWGVEWHDDNLADSYGLAHLASGRHTLAYETEVYLSVTKE